MKEGHADQQTTEAAIFGRDGTLLHSMGGREYENIDIMSLRGTGAPPDNTTKDFAKQLCQAAEYTFARIELKNTPEDLTQSQEDIPSVAYPLTDEVKTAALD